MMGREMTWRAPIEACKWHVKCKELYKAKAKVSPKRTKVICYSCLLYTARFWFLF